MRYTSPMKQVAVITGGSEGVGAAIAKKLSETHTVYILSRHEPANPVGHWLQCDVTDMTTTQNVINQIIEIEGSISVLVNDAGVWLEGKLTDATPEQIRAVLAVNTQGTINATYAVLPSMQQQKKGTIVNIISLAGVFAKSKRSIYAASKFAITGFTKSLQQEAAEDNIRVMGVYPGKINTQLFSKVGNVKDMSDALQPEDVANTVAWAIAQPDHVVVQSIEVKHIKH